MRRVCWFWSSETAWYGTLSEEIRMELFLLFVLIVCFVSYREIAEASDSPKLKKEFHPDFHPIHQNCLSGTKRLMVPTHFRMPIMWKKPVCIGRA